VIEFRPLADSPDREAIVGAEPGLAGVDLLIGEEELVGRGLGPDVCSSWRAFEKSGFRHVRDVEEDWLPHRLLRLDRRYAQ
jgi:hypothetical protein